MDYSRMLDYHKETKAEYVATLPVPPTRFRALSS